MRPVTPHPGHGRSDIFDRRHALVMFLADAEAGKIRAAADKPVIAHPAFERLLTWCAGSFRANATPMLLM